MRPLDPESGIGKAVAVLVKEVLLYVGRGHIDSGRPLTSDESRRYAIMATRYMRDIALSIGLDADDCYFMDIAELLAKGEPNFHLRRGTHA